MKTFAEKASLLNEDNRDEIASSVTDVFVFRHFINSSLDLFFLPLSLFLLGHYLIPSLYL